MYAILGWLDMRKNKYTNNSINSQKNNKTLTKIPTLKKYQTNNYKKTHKKSPPISPPLILSIPPPIVPIPHNIITIILIFNL